MRLLAIWMVAAVVVTAATAGLLWWSTASSAQFEVDAERLSVSGQLTLASTERLDRLLEEHEGLSTFVLGDIAAESDTTSLMQKGLLLRGAGLSTELADGVTLSGDAVYLFLAGVERRLGNGARAGGQRLADPCGARLAFATGAPGASGTAGLRAAHAGVRGVLLVPRLRPERVRR
jgi:hypothetical protein